MKILCYGDSNTWAQVPNIDGYSKDAIIEKYADEDSWWYPLKEFAEVYVNGLPGRCISHENKWLKGRNASETIYDDLKDYNNLDLVIIQLGTNDCKNMYGDSAEDICNNLNNFALTVRDVTHANIMIISPAIIRENNKITKRFYIGGEEKSTKLDSLYHDMATTNNLLFVSGKDLELGEDGEHLTKDGHIKLGQQVSAICKKLSIDIDFCY
ncbi:MAG: hypothetical protein E7345_03370 [Clostridiales bacterium]|nr:hypothetical protein [Clostridiales bacterium]